MNIHNMIVQAIHAAMCESFDTDIAINDWDRHQQTLEGVVEDGCFYVHGTGLAIDSPEWQGDLELITKWFDESLESESFKQLKIAMDKRWAKFEK
jgi:hypothetical protein